MSAGQRPVEVSPLLVTFLPDEEDKHVKEHELQIASSASRDSPQLETLRDLTAFSRFGSELYQVTLEAPCTQQLGHHCRTPGRGPK